MYKKPLFIALIWALFLIIVLTIYLLRDSPVQAIIDWTLHVWVILGALFAGAIFISTLVIRHNFGETKHKIVLDDLLLEGEDILKKIDEQEAEVSIALADNWKNRTHDYLKKELPSHASIFLSDSGLNKPDILKRRIENRLTRIRQILGYPDS